MNTWSDGQVVGGLVFVVVPLALLGLAWLEARLDARRAEREARARLADELAARRDQARKRRRERVLALNASDPHPYRSELAARKLRELRTSEHELTTEEWLAGPPAHPDDPYL